MRALSTFLFATIVASYVLVSIGLPVYLHYCGGELENVSYVLKGDSCCGGEDDCGAEDDGCCKDEGVILKSVFDFTYKQNTPGSPTPPELTLFGATFYAPCNVYALVVTGRQDLEISSVPEIQKKIISCSVLRI